MMSILRNEKPATNTDKTDAKRFRINPVILWDKGRINNRQFLRYFQLFSKITYFKVFHPDNSISGIQTLWLHIQ